MLRTAERWRRWRMRRSGKTAVVSRIVIGRKRRMPRGARAGEVCFAPVSVCGAHRDGHEVRSAQGVKTTRAGKGTAGGRREKVDAWLASESKRGIHRRMGTATVRDDGRGAHWLEPPLSGVALKVRATWALSTTATCPVNKAGRAVGRQGRIGMRNSQPRRFDSRTIFSLIPPSFSRSRYRPHCSNAARFSGRYE